MVSSLDECSFCNACGQLIYVVFDFSSLQGRHGFENLEFAVWKLRCGMIGFSVSSEISGLSILLPQCTYL